MNKKTLFAGLAALIASAGFAEAKTVCYVTAADSHAYVTPANKAIDARARELGVEVLSLSHNFDVQTGVQQINN